MTNKEAESIEFIKKLRASSKSPAVAWSGGKDSMVLLHLVRRAIGDTPVFMFREPWQPSKYDFQNSIISKWNLVCHTWHPCNSTFQQNGDEFEIQNEYMFGVTKVTCPSGITKPVDGFGFVCSIDMLSRPKQATLYVDWDMVFVGHKHCDSDVVLGGDAGTRIDIRRGSHATLAFPLKDWSHDEIWEYIERNDVPWDEGRYEKVDGKYREKQDRTKNVDYVHACTACVDKRLSPNDRVFCPKYNAVVESVSHLVPWYPTQEPLPYMKD